MPRRIIRARRAVSRRIGASIIVLTSLSVILLCAIAWLFMGLNERQRSIYDSVREDALWAAYQTDREASRLVQVLLEPAREGQNENVSQRFDLLYSRTTLLSSGTYAAVFSEGSLGAISSRLIDLTQQMATMVDGESNSLGAALLPLAEDFRAASGQLLVAANAEAANRRLAERHSALATYARIAISVGALTVVLGLIVGLLALQLRHSARTGREIELLSRRNARIAKRANAASDAKSAFLATMSHEIRTPLNGILGIADLLQGSGLTAEQRQHVAILKHSGDMLLDVINDVLNYSKLEAEAVRFESATVALSTLFLPVEAMMRTRAQADDLALRFNYTDHMITADANRIRQILVNLLGNAIKFTERGEVSVTAALDGDRLRIEVRDTGPGIAAADLPRLFKDFSQLDNTSTRSFGGTGLGLAICKRLTSLMGGEIGVSSQPGLGSCFWFELPVGPTTEIAQAARQANAVGETRQFSGRVLVVDDNEVNRQVASLLLERLGANVAVASNGEDAISAVTAQTFDLVLMDMNMPKLDGLGATRKMRELSIAVPIIGLTANAYDSDRQACLDAGMNDHLAKPITTQKLTALLNTYLVADVAALAFDASLQQSLIEEIGEDVFYQLVREFIDTSRPELEAMELMFEAGDQKALDDRLHTLKGAAQTLGLSSIAASAQSAREPADCVFQLRHLHSELSQLQTEYDYNLARFAESAEATTLDKIAVVETLDQVGLSPARGW